jgi:hypothetical protein
MRTRLVLVAAAMLTLLAGCAAGGTGAASSADSGSPSVPATAPSSPAPSTSPPGEVIPQPTGKQPTGKPTAGAPITVVGTVQEGVEATCLVLRTDSTSASYLLLNGDPAVVRAGAHLRVTGVVRTDVMSYCMQGIPLEVTQAAPA